MPFPPLVIENKEEKKNKNRIHVDFLWSLPKELTRATGSAVVENLQGSSGFQSLRCLYKKQVEEEIVVGQCSHSSCVYVPPSLWSSEMFK